MAEISDLWAPSIDMANVSPLSILKAQAEMLREKTAGLLDPLVETTMDARGLITHELFVKAPLLFDYAVPLVAVWHRDDGVYPVEIEKFERIFRRSGRCVSTEQFAERLAELLQHDTMVAQLNSLIAQCNEKLAEQAAAPVE